MNYARALTLASIAVTIAACTPKDLPEYVVIQDIVDPITFVTEDGDRVRLIGVRAPSVGSVVECYGKEALEIGESLVGKRVRLEVEPLLTHAEDGAYPRYVWLDTGESSATPPPAGTGSTASGATASGATMEKDTEILVNERGLEMGVYFPHASQEMIHGSRLVSAARYSSATGRGLWKACSVQSQQLPQGIWLSTNPQTECIIKGRVTDDGRKLYRTPSCAAYGETLVILSRGDRWFCAEDTANDAGFSRASDCPEVKEEQ